VSLLSGLARSFFILFSATTAIIAAALVRTVLLLPDARLIDYCIATCIRPIELWRLIMSINLEVVDFLSDFTGIDKIKIQPETLINEELGVDGDDGLELLDAFSKKFEVNLDLLDKTYFGGEGYPFLSLIAWPLRFLLGKKLNGNIQSPLTVDTLIKSAQCKKWTD
jgi:acyl carrier protein